MKCNTYSRDAQVSKPPKIERDNYQSSQMIYSSKINNATFIHKKQDLNLGEESNLEYQEEPSITLNLNSISKKITRNHSR